jgi:pyruvate formate lyase activating enzyme
MGEKGIIFDIKKYAINDGPGIRTTVFFKGCPLNCWWCHNPESRHCGVEYLEVEDREKGSGTKMEIIGHEVNSDEVIRIIKKDRVYYDESGGGVTFSGGEPTLQMLFLLDLLERCCKLHIHTAIDTSGYTATGNLNRLEHLVDLYLFDLKVMDNEKHKQFTGVSNAPIKENLEFLLENGNNVELRLPLIPGITDTNENITQVIDYLTTLSGINDIRILPYNMLNIDKLKRFLLKNELGDLAVQKSNVINNIQERFLAMGYNVQIGG